MHGTTFSFPLLRLYLHLGRVLWLCSDILSNPITHYQKLSLKSLSAEQKPQLYPRDEYYTQNRTMLYKWGRGNPHEYSFLIALMITPQTTPNLWKCQHHKCSPLKSSEEKLHFQLWFYLFLFLCSSHSICFVPS